MPNELDETLARVEMALGQEQDRQVENLREQRLEELTKDELECQCGQWFPLGEGKVCDQCYRMFCNGCLAPAKDPVNGEKLLFVCPSCRERIAEIEQAEAFYRLEPQITAALKDHAELLGELRRVR